MLQQVIYYKTMESPVGPLRLAASMRGLCGVLFAGEDLKIAIPGEMVQKDGHPLLLEAEKQLHEYFRGERWQFRLKLDPRGTVFQMKAWRQLSAIPFGETISYGEQAGRMGDANKARAVGAANGRNPLAIVVPCHRVIGANGSMTGFGGGVQVKEWLLAHEKKAKEKLAVSA